MREITYTCDKCGAKTSDPCDMTIIDIDCFEREMDGNAKMGDIVVGQVELCRLCASQFYGTVHAALGVSLIDTKEEA